MIAHSFLGSRRTPPKASRPRRRFIRALMVSLACAVAGACRGESTTTPATGGISTITVSPQTLTVGVGSSVALEVGLLDAVGQPASPRTVFWSSSDASVARVSAAGLVTAVAPGSVQISATVQGKSAVANVLVAPRAVASVQLSRVELRLTIGERLQLTASARDASGAPLTGRVITWSVTNPTIAVVDSTGAVTGLAPGGTTVTATSEGRIATAAVFVTSVPVASIVVTPASTSIVEGQTTPLRAESRSAAGVVLSGRTTEWTSANAAVASVSSSGLVTGVSTGSTIITATSEGRTATAAITITARPVNGIVVSPAQLSLVTGQVVSLTVQITDALGNVLTGRPVTYRSDNTGVAQVSGSGVVTAVAPGTTTITVTSEGRSASVGAVVSAVPIASIRVTPDQSSLIVGGDTVLSATALDAAGGTLRDRAITWSSGAPSVAAVSSAGVVTAAGVGNVIILAQAEGRTGSATVIVRAPPIASVRVAPANASVEVGGTVDLVATVRDVNGAVVTGRSVAWASSTPAVATVSSAGRVTAVAAGTSTIIATVDGKSGTAQVLVSSPVVQTVGQVVVSPSSATIMSAGPANRTVQLQAIVYADGASGGGILASAPVMWTSNAPLIATVSVTGLVTALAEGTAIIRATSGPQSGTSTITVVKR